LRPIKLNERLSKQALLANLVTHRRSWLRQRTDASPHTNYLFQFLKSAASSRRCRCAVARQKRNFKPIFSLRQSPQVSSRGDRAVRFRLFATGFSTGVRREGGASYCLVSGRQPPRFQRLSRARRPVEPASPQLRFQRHRLQGPRILLFDFRASTGAAKIFCDAPGRLPGWSIFGHGGARFRGHLVNLQERDRGSRKIFSGSRTAGPSPAAARNFRARSAAVGSGYCPARTTSM